MKINHYLKDDKKIWFINTGISDWDHSERIIEWCINQFGSEKYEFISWTFYNETFYFSELSDAILFLLTWEE